MYGYEDEAFYPPYRPVSDSCQNIPDALLRQGSIWVDSQHRVHDIAALHDGHLDNIIKWLREHALHDNSWKTPVLISPLMRALEAEQKKRIPKRNSTPRQALMDVILNDTVITGKIRPSARSMVARIMGGLKDRGFEVRKVKE